MQSIAARRIADKIALRLFPKRGSKLMPLDGSLITRLYSVYVLDCRLFYNGHD